MNGKSTHLTPQPCRIAGPDEPFPYPLLTALRQLSTMRTDASLEGADGNDERPAKRRRLVEPDPDPDPDPDPNPDPDPVSDPVPVPVPIALIRESITISRPVGADPPIVAKGGSIALSNANRYFSFSLEREGHLMICTTSRFPGDYFECTLGYCHNLPSTTCMGLSYLAESREDTENPDGALYLLTNIVVEEKRGMHRMHFTFTANWNDGTYMFRDGNQRCLSQSIFGLLRAYKASQTDMPLYREDLTLSNRNFYEAAFVPDRDSFNDLNAVAIPGLTAGLYSFQRRTLQWLLMREGVKYSNTGPDGKLELEACPQPSQAALPYSFKAHKDANGQRYYISDLYHVATRDLTRFKDPAHSFYGGILADQMGLGKTIEMISLILTHKRSPHPRTEIHASTNREVRSSGATLIVVPVTLESQWLSEIEKHAPDLLVIQYCGMRAWDRNEQLDPPEEGQGLTDKLASKLANYDVVITTYSVLQSEIHYARDPPARSMRSHTSKRERRTSPLTQISWWRICLDEAQQVDSGTTSAAQLACLLPRVNSWAVTGTPIRESLNDLWGLLLFLRCEPFASCRPSWDALLQTHKSLFAPLVRNITIRHSRQATRDELDLPSQQRYLVTVPFSKIEEYNYTTNFAEYTTKIWLHIAVDMLKGNWFSVYYYNSYTEQEANNSLTHLRRLTVHPKLGGREDWSRSLKKTLIEHLDTMTDKSEANLKIHQRSYWITRLSRGQLLEGSLRVRESLQLWEEVLNEVQPMVLEARETLQRELEIARPARRDTSDASDASDASDDETPDEETADTTKVGDARRTLRLLLDIEHKALFLVASACFQIRSNEDLTIPASDEFNQLQDRELEGYEQAQRVRREILQEPFAKASRLMRKLEERAATGPLNEIPELKPPDLRGAETSQIAETLKHLTHSLNLQASTIREWREHTINLLLHPLVDWDEPEDTTGREYENSTEVQDHLMVHISSLGAIIADRQEALTGLINERIVHEAAATKRQAQAGEGHAPELFLELFQQREETRAPRKSSLRSIIVDLRELARELRHKASIGSNRARDELQILTTKLEETQAILAEQSKAAVSLERELEFLTSVMNVRVDFYRQLQSLSDDVAPLDLAPGDLETSWNAKLKEESDLEKKIRHWRSKCSHLLSLKEDSAKPCVCPICHETYYEGYITTCHHRFCYCIFRWLREHPKCPICKERQTRGMLTTFKTGTGLIRGLIRCHPEQSRDLQGSQLPVGPKKVGVYREIDEAKLRAIQNIQLRGPSYSTKVDMLVKHILWLREDDPGAKSIIFTQYKPLFPILEEALARNRVSFVTFIGEDRRRTAPGLRQFKDDPSVECLLMNAKVHASGLNLVQASHVFFCEPLMNTALELQAIARVDRIGQAVNTTIWLYVIQGTVEENIVRISERRRLEHMGFSVHDETAEEEGVDGASLEISNPLPTEEDNADRPMQRGRSGEDVIDISDSWECLFGPDGAQVPPHELSLVRGIEKGIVDLDLFAENFPPDIYETVVRPFLQDVIDGQLIGLRYPFTWVDEELG